MIIEDMSPFEIRRLQDAGEWLQRLNEMTDPALPEEWMEWCRSDPRNLAAFEKMQQIWDEFPDTGEGLAVRHAVWHAELAAASPIANRPAARSAHRHKALGLAAVLLVFVCATAVLTLRSSPPEAFASATGEQRHVTLPDGSDLDLAPDSRGSSRFTWLRHDVQLEHGQAFFKIARDARPLEIHVGGVTLTATDAAFDVRIDPDGLAVTVGQGSADLVLGAPAAGDGRISGAQVIHAHAGQRVSFSAATRRFDVAVVEPTAAGAWRDGILRFVGEPLENVVNEVNRYGGRKIDLAAAFRQIRFTGTVFPHNVEDWLKALEQIYIVEVVDQGANGVYIRSRN